MGKNYSINVKTFEAFKEDNQKYYPIVLETINTIAETLVKGSNQAGNWLIEGQVDFELFPDMGEDSASSVNELRLMNDVDKQDIFIDWTFSVEKGRVTPDTDITPGDTEYNTNIIVDGVLLQTEEATNEYHIVVDDTMSKAVENLLMKINQAK